MSYTVLVRYYEFIDSCHWAFDGHKEIKAKILTVNNLEEINDIIQNIQDIKILTSK